MLSNSHFLILDFERVTPINFELVNFDLFKRVELKLQFKNAQLSKWQEINDEDEKSQSEKLKSLKLHSIKE